MSAPIGEPRKELGPIPYVFAALAFIPGFGILLGIPSIGWGLFHRSRGGLRVAAVAGIGVALNIIGYSVLFYEGVVKKDGVFADARRKLTQMQLQQAVVQVEYWHLQSGHYPDSLAQLVSKDSARPVLSIYDPNVNPMAGRSQLPYFFYSRSTDRSHYWLRSLGDDGQPFTADDVVPELPDSERAKTGLLIAAP